MLPLEPLIEPPAVLLPLVPLTFPDIDIVWLLKISSQSSLPPALPPLLSFTTRSALSLKSEPSYCVHPVGAAEL